MKNVLVLFGGKSSEYEVSLRSAYAVMKNIPADKYSIIPVGITKCGRWYLFEGDIEKIPTDNWQEEKITPATVSLDGDGTIMAMRQSGIEKIKVDICFPVLHGKNGEDGTVQGLFEMAGIKYVGCHTLSSAMCMDKAITNTIADYNSIDQAKWLGITRADYEDGKEAFADKCIEKLSLPVFIKPANAGSSVGISKAKSKEDILKAMDIAFKEDSKVVAEEAIIGKEVECAVLGNDRPIASIVGEVVPDGEFYDYEAKYISGESELLIPAPISEEKQNEIRAQAIKVYKALDCKGLSRVDFFLQADGKIKFNEINTLPGFTSISMYSKLFAQSGIPYDKLVDRLLTLAEEA